MKAKEAILSIVHEFDSMTKEEVTIDQRIHPMIIGRKGAGIRKIMTDFKVDIKLPREGDADPNLVVIMGSEDACLDCKVKTNKIYEKNKNVVAASFRCRGVPRWLFGSFLRC